jgi:hypothetical protein
MDREDYDMKVEVAVLQSVVYKIDSAVAEIAKSSTEVTRLLAVHDSRIGSLELDSRETTTDVRDLYKKMNENTKEIVEKLEDMEERIELKLKEHSDKSIAQHKSISDRLSILENWKWMVIVTLFIWYIVILLKSKVKVKGK